MDIKTIATGIGLLITISGLILFQGQLIERVEVLESQVVDTKPIEKDIIAIKKDIEQLQKKTRNPLSQ
ncbi:hypothetical protein [Hyphomonas sp.]|uniref:hypothetical protein n=1 Tax=Hyphomonas sp. TaxID=87 RepID=UPI000C96C872|nr:hypothetical protein [Hyphomonas sp.]MAL42898.1 hypothetical protein [Hyphomonas sp.]